MRLSGSQASARCPGLLVRVRPTGRTLPTWSAPRPQAHGARYPDGRAYEVRVRVVSPLKTCPQAAWAEEAGKPGAPLGEGAATDPRALRGLRRRPPRGHALLQRQHYLPAEGPRAGRAAAARLGAACTHAAGGWAGCPGTGTGEEAATGQGAGARSGAWSHSWRHMPR